MNTPITHVQVNFTVEECTELLHCLERAKQVFVDRKIELDNEIAKHRQLIARIREHAPASLKKPEPIDPLYPHP